MNEEFNLILYVDLIAFFVQFYIQLLYIDTFPFTYMYICNYVSGIWVLAYINTKKFCLTQTLTFFHFYTDQHLLFYLFVLSLKIWKKTSSKIRILYQNWNQPAIKLLFLNVPHRITLYKTGVFDRKRQRWELIH